MFILNEFLNLFKISTVFASTENPDSSAKRNSRKICKEQIKKEAFREYKPGDCPKPPPRKACEEIGRGGRHGRGPHGGQKKTMPDGCGPRDRGSIKDAGDSGIVPTAVATCGISSPAGDQATPVSVPRVRVETVKRRNNCGICGSGVGDRGATGAGVTGSRTEVDCGDGTGLPAGALYPGLLRHIHNAARYTLPLCFEGACISVKQSTNNNWVLGHSMSFSSVTPGGYKLLLSYIDKNRPSALPYFVMETAPGGQVSCEFRVSPSKNSRAAFVSQIADNEFKSFESIIDFYFNSATASMIAVNREFIAFHYLQGITKKLSVGAEVVARGQLTEVSASSGAVRWATDHVAISGTVGNRGVDVCYARAVKPHLTVAAMFEVGFAARRAVATLAYEWRGADWLFRGSLDSDGLVGGTLHHRLGGRKSLLTCAVSALLNHPNDKFKLGFGVNAAVL